MENHNYSNFLEGLAQAQHHINESRGYLWHSVPLPLCAGKAGENLPLRLTLEDTMSIINPLHTWYLFQMGRELCVNIRTLYHPQSYSYQEDILLNVNKCLLTFMGNIQIYNWIL